MRRFLRCSFLLSFLLFSARVGFAQPRNIILCIGDGMGLQEVQAASIYAYGQIGKLVFEQFPHKARIRTSTAYGRITDSAAAGTAMATGRKVKRGVLSLEIPGSSGKMETILEKFKAMGKRTGLVTTSYITDATPAAFGAHESSRENRRQIAEDYLQRSRPNVMLGGGGAGITRQLATRAGYRVVTNAVELQAAVRDHSAFLSGQFGQGGMPFENDGLGPYPHLADMAEAAISLLDRGGDGFFLMVEGGLIDYAGHANDIARDIGETLGFARTVERLQRWAKGRQDVLLIVTADHETGGLTVLENKGVHRYPVVKWSTTWHTDARVPLYAVGEGAEVFAGTLENTAVYDVLSEQRIASSRHLATSSSFLPVSPLP